MIKLLIYNLESRLIEWLTKPKYDFVDSTLDKLGKL